MMSKTECITSYRKQGYRLLEIPINPDDPKALTRKGWDTEQSNLNIGKNNLYAVIQEDNRLGVDIDDVNFNHILDDYINKTLGVRTGNDGRHWYFMDKPRLKPIKSSKLYHNGKIIGDIKANKSYLIGCGSSYLDKKDGKTKTYTQISSTSKVMELDFEEILLILKKNNITTKKEIKTESKFEDGLEVGERNDECFKTACNLFEKEKLDFEAGLNFVKTWNGLSKQPLDNLEVETVVKSAWNRINNKAKLFSNKQFTLVAQEIQKDNHFLTFRENRKMWNYDVDEGVYRPYAHTVIEEECQKLVLQCTNKTVKEVIETIRRNKTMIYMKDLLESKHINTQNGIIDPKTFELKPHSPKYLTTTKLPFAVNLKARNLKLWNQILTIIDVRDINYIIELIWICISGDNPFKRMFVFKGETNTQKTTLADILVWIIGAENVARQKPEAFLSRNSRFGTSKFIGKRINIASEIGNLTEDMLENQKSLIGAELQNTERKSDNAEYHFDPTRFVFLYTTNKLGRIYSSINDNSVITRFQFLIFRNKIEDSKANGQWFEAFFDDEDDIKTSIDTIVNIVINYKKAQSLGKIPKTKWSTIAETKQILKEQMPIVDKYFEDERIIQKDGAKLTIDEIRRDFESFIGSSVKPQDLGYILKKNGFRKSSSNGITYYKGWSFNTKKNQTLGDYAE